METFRIIASQVLLWIGVGSLVSLAAGCVFHILYDTPLSPRGAAIVAVLAAIAMTLGKRLTGLQWRLLIMIGITMLGLALAAGPIRSFSFQQLDNKDVALIVVGGVMMLSGFWMLRQQRLARND